jgi:hypothetical protein
VLILYVYVLAQVHIIRRRGKKKGENDQIIRAVGHLDEVYELISSGANSASAEMSHPDDPAETGEAGAAPADPASKEPTLRLVEVRFVLPVAWGCLPLYSYSFKKKYIHSYRCCHFLLHGTLSLTCNVLLL